MPALRLPDDEALLDAFYRELYLPAFAHQREPLEVWKDRLAGGPYDLTILVREDLSGGVVLERYRASNVGFLTYLVVAPHARNRGLGRALLDEAIALLGTDLVVGEIHDPAKGGDPARLARFLRWGARVLDLPYVQPDLGAGLGRDHDLLLVTFSPGPIDGVRIQAFLTELFAITEGRDPDDELRTLLASCAREIAVR